MTVLEWGVWEVPVPAYSLRSRKLRKPDRTSLAFTSQMSIAYMRTDWILFMKVITRDNDFSTTPPCPSRPKHVYFHASSILSAPVPAAAVEARPTCAWSGGG